MMFSQSDAAFFLRSKETIKTYKKQKKEQWIENALRVQNDLFDNLSVEAENFLDFFDGTA